MKIRVANINERGSFQWNRGHIGRGLRTHGPHGISIDGREIYVLDDAARKYLLLESNGDISIIEI